MPSSRSLPEPPTRRRILIVDDHPLVRRGLSELISGENDLEVCAAVATGAAALEAITAPPPDLVITDLTLREGSGLDLVRKIRSVHEGVPVLVLSPHDATGYAERALKAGARGCVTKQETTEVLLVAIRRVLAGGTYKPGDRANRAGRV